MKQLFPHSFGAMLWKEVRENVVWAALGALALVAINYMLLSDLTRNTVFGTYVDNGPLRRWVEWGTEPVYATGVAPLLAIVLGFMQIIPELRRDQWAFLVHRPLTFATIFRYKATAGLLLYFVSMGGTFLVLWALRWFTITRFVPELPFDGRFMLGGVADILVGVPCYFAGMLCGVRVTRWYGSRFMPLVGCVLLCFYSFGFQEFYQVIAAVLVSSLVLGLAARSSFMGQGQYGPQKKVGRLALGISLLPGLFTLGVLVVLLYDVWLKAFISSPRDWKDNDGGFVRYGVLPDGEPVQGIQKPGITREIFKDLDGREKKVDDAEVRYFEGSLMEDDWESYRYAQRYLIYYDYYSDFEAPPAYFSLYSAKKRLFLLFSQNWNFIGYATPTGYYPKGTPLPRSAGFQGKLIARIGDRQLWFTDGIYRFDLNQKTIKRILSMDNIEAAIWHGVFEKNPSTSSDSAPFDPGVLHIPRKLINQSLAIVTPTTIEWRGRDRQPLFRVRREYSRHLYSNISTEMNRAGNRFYILYQPGTKVPEMKRRKLPLFLMVYNEKGQVLARHELPPYPVQRSYIAEDISVFGMILPLVALVGYLAYAFSGMVAYGVAPGLWLDQLAFHIPDIVTMSILAFCMAIASCIGLWLLRRCSGLTKHSLLVWLITVFLLGPVGLLLFLAMRGWPARVACPSCGKLRVVDFERCENCGAAWPVREKDGTEILPEKPTA